jgi:adenine-specific DNA-methyltransferase
MPTLNWIGKEAVVKHHKDVPYRLLEPQPELSCGDSNSGNLIVQGDNLHALKALLPRYAGQVKCIYIDPPYNTGSEGWAYNDNVNSAEIRKWLGKVVGKEVEDLTRHDKWLCMMYPRLTLLREFLRDDGIIFVSADNNEIHNLRLLFDEIFGARKFITCIANINNPKGRSDDKYFPTAHEYVLVYKKRLDPPLFGWKPEDKVLKRYNKKDSNGKRYREIDLRKTGDEDRREDRPDMFYYFYYNKKTSDFFATYEQKTIQGYVEIVPLKDDGSLGRWRWGIDTANKDMSCLLPKLMPVRKVWSVFEKDYLHENEKIKLTSVVNSGHQTLHATSSLI